MGTRSGLESAPQSLPGRVVQFLKQQAEKLVKDDA